MKLKLLIISLLACGFAISANAGAIIDTDGDLIPDVFDNCLLVPNGPNDASNQVNTNAGSDYSGPTGAGQVAGDVGNVCDADFNDDGFVDGPDIADWISNGFNTTNPLYDLNADGFVDGPDFILINFNGTPGPGASAH